MVGAVQSHRTGPNIKLRRWFSAKEQKGRREMVIDEVRVINKKDVSYSCLFCYKALCLVYAGKR